MHEEELMDKLAKEPMGKEESDMPQETEYELGEGSVLKKMNGL
jgi:hypothetical protein